MRFAHILGNFRQAQDAMSAAINSLRMKLTIWYSGALALVLLLFSVGIYFVLSYLSTGQKMMLNCGHS